MKDFGVVKELRTKLDARGAHLTRQRAAVFLYLSQIDNHPTAEEVFLAVKADVPRISLATVYKNLEALVVCGAASKLTYGDAAARYDIRTDHHYHSRCLRCSRIRDLDPQVEAELGRLIKPPKDFEVNGYRVEVIGYCHSCQQQQKKSN